MVFGKVASNIQKATQKDGYYSLCVIQTPQVVYPADWRHYRNLVAAIIAPPFNFIAEALPNDMVVIELSEGKTYHEIIGIWKANHKKVKKMRKKTNRDGGQSIITNQSS